MDESELNAAMDRYACGDAGAFRAIHGALYPRILAYLTRMTGSQALAGDLTQETFLRLHRARATFARGGAVVPWAYAIARNVHVDHARAARQRSAERLPSDPGAEPADVEGADAEAMAVASELARAVERVLARIPAAQREAFVLLRYEGLTGKDAAAVLGTTETAVKLRAFRAYEALRAELEPLRRLQEEKRAQVADRAKPGRGDARSSARAVRAGGADGAEPG